ncbi:DUF396-domain-containing protein [Amylocystis lapponica]|nr:DUF396-domain-containing protein [Amylocystis lapponica]
MTALHYLSYAGGAAAFIFVTLSLASGLLWLSELIEEHSRIAKVIGRRGIYAIMVIHVVLYASDNMPLKHILFSIFCHIVYLQNFTSSWPFISLTSLSFIASCVLVILDHFLWFFYFAQITRDARHRSMYRRPPPSKPIPGFADIATFFGVCVWLSPLFLFLSLSANDNALPVNAELNNMPTSPVSPSKLIISRPRASLFKTLYDNLPRVRSRQRRDTSEGLIAPRSPNPMRASPSPTPMPTTPTGLQRVPSMNSLPPRLLSPSPMSPRFTNGSSPAILAAGEVEVDSSVMLTPFSLASPPRRMSGNRLEMRRVSSYASSVSEDA